MSKLIQIAIACCPTCSTGYDLDELRELAECGRKERDDGAIFEVRRCHCGAEFSTRVDGLDELNLWRNADDYLGSFGTQRAHRAVDAAEPRRGYLDIVAIWVALTFLALLIIATTTGWW